MKIPECLPEKGKIGFVAPSFGCVIEPYHTAFANALKKFEEMGHPTILGPNCYADDGIGISSTPQKCGQELTAFYCEDRCDILLSCGGGELMCEILDDVDFERIRQADPKWYMGFSDNTNFTYLLPTLCDTAAIYGPCAPAFGMEPWHPSLQDAYHLLRGRQNTVQSYAYWEKESLKDEKHPLAPYHTTEPSIMRAYLGQRELTACETVTMNGRLLGGCMDCLVNLVGTRFDHTQEFLERYREDGILWFMEACDLNVMAIRRAIWHMKEAGWFRFVKGFLIGRPLQFGEEMMGLDQYHAVIDLLANYNVPIIMDADIGHLPPMLPLICGARATVSYQNRKLTIQYR